MFTSKAKKVTDLSQVFLEPANATHRQYQNRVYPKSSSQ